MAVTLNDIKVDFGLGALSPRVTFLQGANMDITNIRDTIRLIEESEEGRVAPGAVSERGDGRGWICRAGGNFQYSEVESSALVVEIMPPFEVYFEAGPLPFQTSTGSILGTFADSPGAVVQVNNAIGASNLNSKETADIKFLIETLRPHHTGLGNIWYWNPDEGDDTADGKSAETAFKTFAAAHNTAANGNHDVIVAISGVPGQTITTETIEISKNYLLLRGPGRDFRFKPTSTGAPTISINAIGVEVSSLVVDTADTGSQSAVQVQDGADFFFLDHLWSEDARSDSIEILGATSYGRIDGCFLANPGGSGIHINGDTRHTRIKSTEVLGAADDGILIEGTTAQNNIIDECVKVYSSGGYGVRIESPATKNYIGSGVSLYNNTSGSLVDNGPQNTDHSPSRAIEGGKTMDEISRVVLAGVAGSGGPDIDGDGKTKYKSQDGSKDRISADVSSTGIRSNVQTDGT